MSSVVHSILNPPPTVYYRFNRLPVYEHTEYLKALKKNNDTLDIPFVSYTIPDATPIKIVEKGDEPFLSHLDRIKVDLKVLKNGNVRVKVNAAAASLYDSYYRHAKQPPMKMIVQAYKSHGFSSVFLDKIKNGYTRNKLLSKKFGPIIDKIFNKGPVKKAKKEKPPPPPEEVVEEEEEEEEDQVPGDEGELDVEPDEEEVVEEEEYFSEPET